jgi:hypothetical protein
MRPFWQRRSRYTRVVLYTLLLPIEGALNVGYGVYDHMKEWPRDVRSNYKELWKTQ